MKATIFMNNGREISLDEESYLNDQQFDDVRDNCDFEEFIASIMFSQNSITTVKKQYKNSNGIIYKEYVEYLRNDQISNILIKTL